MAGNEQQSGKAGKQARVRATDDGVNSQRDGEGGDSKRNRADGQGAQVFGADDYNVWMSGTGGELDPEQPCARAGRNLLARLGEVGGGITLVAGRAQDYRPPTCGLSNCLCPAGHQHDPYITTPGEAGKPRIPKRCESPDCNQILYRCEVQGWVWELARKGRRPIEGLMRCNRCRGGWGQCVQGNLASVKAGVADYMTGVRGLQKLLAKEASQDAFSDEDAGQVRDALMRAVDACVAGAPEGTMLLIAVQKASGDWLREIYSIWERDGIVALLQSVGACAPDADGKDLLFTACCPLIEDEWANWLESEKQFAVLSRVLDGENPPEKLLWRSKNVIPLFCRGTAVDYEEGQGRQGQAMGQGGSSIMSFSGVSVWRANPIPVGQLQPIVSETPKSKLSRIAGDALGDGDYKQIKYGASERMLEIAREEKWRSATPWHEKDRGALSARCIDTLKHEHVRTFGFPAPKPMRASCFTDTETIVRALTSLRDNWEAKKSDVLAVYDKLQTHVYDKWDAGKRSWVDIRKRTGRTKSLLLLFRKFVASVESNELWEDEELLAQVQMVETSQDGGQEEEEEEEDEALMDAVEKDFAADSRTEASDISVSAEAGDEEGESV